MPPGVPFIIGNEAAERFSYYGMKAVLVVFMTRHLQDSSGDLDLMSDAKATAWFHTFGMAVYGFPIVGAVLADAFWGKYKTILALSAVYCAGHLALALDETRLGLGVGLTLIAIGSGGIKPCVSAHVGDQFGFGNRHLLERVFQWFYLSINLGSTLSTLLTPFLLEHYGPHLAFGLPGALMLFATIIFWRGRTVFVHIPPSRSAFVSETLSREGLTTLGKLGIIYAFVAMFWALFDQTASTWVLQAEKMDRHLFGIEWLSSQLQVANPILVMLFIPLFSYVVYPLMNRCFRLTPLKKISIGFFVTVPAFLIPAMVEQWIQAGEFPSIAWQLLSYVFITAAEIMVSITCLEFSYTQAPRKMKSLVMAAYLMSVMLGNGFTALVNFGIQNPAPGFTPDLPGEYTVQLTLRDGRGASSVGRQTIFVLNDAPNSTNPTLPVQQPAIDASAPPRVTAVAPGKKVRLYGIVSEKGSKKADEFRWSFVALPSESRLSDQDLEDRERRNTVFTPDVEGTYTLQLHYRIGDRLARTEILLIATLENLAPVAKIEALDPVRLASGDVELDGRASYDPDGDELKAEWSLVRAPEGSTLGSSDLKGRSHLGPTTVLDGPSYYYFFAAMMLLTALLFIPVALWYRGKIYIQSEDGTDARVDADS